ncbi:hypothetical protein J6590_018783 [Homalodisca vitripennis]|nr:hypothetical protein J6590_018783 [Homalodisca vitripennis]
MYGLSTAAQDIGDIVNYPPEKIRKAATPLCDLRAVLLDPAALHCPLPDCQTHAAALHCLTGRDFTASCLNGEFIATTSSIPTFRTIQPHHGPETARVILTHGCSFPIWNPWFFRNTVMVCSLGIPTLGDYIKAQARHLFGSATPLGIAGRLFLGTSLIYTYRPSSNTNDHVHILHCSSTFYRFHSINYT